MQIKYQKDLKVSTFQYKSQGVFLEALVVKEFSSKGKQPSILFLHGHRSNAWESMRIGSQLASAGFTVFIPTQMGYPFSGGKRDFCGPKTLKGVSDGLAIFLKKQGKGPLGIWGISRGAKVAALLAEQYPSQFNAVVLQSGGYDLATEIKTTLPSIRETILEEIKNTPAEIKRRSPLKDAHKIKSPTLLLHGEKDDRLPKEQAEMMYKKLKASNDTCELRIIKGEGHFITTGTINSYTIPFFRKHLK